MTIPPPEEPQWVADPRFELGELRRPGFGTLKKGGLDPVEVDAYLTRLEKLIKNFAAFTHELEARISHARNDARLAKVAERGVIDDAMLAAFEAKDRILLQAEERAWEIEEEARRRVVAIAESVEVVDPDERIADLRAQLVAAEQRHADLEIQLEGWRRRASRLESDAQRHSELASDVSERHRQADETTQQAGQILAAAERRAGALLAAARAEAAQIAAEAQETADRFVARFAETDEPAADTRRDHSPEG